MKLSVGLIGFGHWGKKLAKKVAERSELKLSLICDIDSKKREEAKYSHSDIHVVDDITHSSDLVDAYIIATPIADQYLIVKKCLELKKHVLVTKTMATNSHRCRELLELAARENLSLVVDYTFLYAGGVKALAQEVGAKRNELRHMLFRRLNVGKFLDDVGVAWDLACHDFSIQLFLLGGEMPESLRAIAQGDQLFIHLSYANEMNSTIHVSWDYPLKKRELTIIGDNENWHYQDCYPEEKLSKLTKGHEVSEGEIKYFPVESESVAFKSVEPLVELLNYFCETLKRPNLDEGEIPQKVVILLEAVERSLAKGGEQVWPTSINQKDDKKLSL